MDTFERAVLFVLKHEGGYVNDVNDPGGETNFGISKRAYPDLDIKNLTKEDAKAIYRRDYWDKIKGDKIGGELAFVLLDSAVNCGVKRTSIWLQMAIKSLSQTKINIDGKIGKNTLLALNGCERSKVILQVISLRLKHYVSLGNKRFLGGWVNRVAELIISV
jgi:lysozyme family protein